MIEGFNLYLQPYCTGCTEFEPAATFSTNAKDGAVTWWIRCENRGRCVRLMNHLNKKLEAKNEKKLED